MNTEAAVRAAKNPQEAMLAIAVALDTLIINVQVPPSEPTDPWGAWESVEQATENADRVRVTGNEERTEVEIPPPSEERKAQRRQFEEQQLRLAEHLGDDADWNEAYARGGPMWLYLGNRELVMSYPEPVRAAMVSDVLEDSPQDAEEMGRDVLKQAGEDGPGSVAMAANDQIVNMP